MRVNMRKTIRAEVHSGHPGMISLPQQNQRCNTPSTFVKTSTDEKSWSYTRLLRQIPRDPGHDGHYFKCHYHMAEGRLRPIRKSPRNRVRQWATICIRIRHNLHSNLTGVATLVSWVNPQQGFRKHNCSLLE